MAHRPASAIFLSVPRPYNSGQNRTAKGPELARLDARRDYHDWGRIGDTREYLRRKLPVLQDRLRASGAIPVDARQPLDQVVDAILSRTRNSTGV